MKANVAWSTNENARLAGKACAKKAVLDLVQTKLAVIFTSTKYNQDELLNGVKEGLGTAPIIGCSSCDGIITTDGYINSKYGFAGMLAIGDSDTAISTAGMEKQITARETGRLVARKAMEKMKTPNPPSYFYMIASPGEEEEYYKGIQDIIGNVECFGETASDDDFSGKWSIFTEDSLFNEGVAVAFFYTNKTIINYFDGMYHETVNSGVITKVKNKRQLEEISGVQALKQYCEWTNLKNRDINGMRLLIKSILNPIGIKSSDGELIVIKYPMSGNMDYSMTMSNDVSENTVAIEMQISVDELIKSPTIAIRKLKQRAKEIGREPACYIIINANGRKLAIGEKIDEMYKTLKDETGDVPFIMPFSFGEYGRGRNTGNLFGSLMISAIAICK